MVCKEDVVTWFKELTSSKRIDVMCSLLNMCLPFELRFLGTCLEDLGKRDFNELRDTEVRANNSAEFSELQCISDKRTQSKLALYLSLLKSCNHACSNSMYKILANLDSNEINTILNSSSDENPLEQLLLLYTLALNHPAFSYEQKAVFGNILVKLQDEEHKMLAAKHQVGISLLYVKPPVQPCAPCPSSEDRQQQDVGVLGHCPGIAIPPSHSAGEYFRIYKHTCNYLLAYSSSFCSFCLDSGIAIFEFDNSIHIVTEITSEKDVVTWFKELTSSKRIDVMCSLLNMCLPFELRFLGTCLEDLGKRDFNELRDTEVRANNSAEFSELQCISDKRTQSKLALYLSLLKSCNHACSNSMYKILANLDSNEINTILNSSSDENPLEQLLLLYTLALNHPAFSYEQKAVFGNILVKLQDEEHKMLAAKHQVGISLLYVKPPVQPCAPCPSSEDRQQQDVGVLGHCPGIAIPPSHSAAGDVNKGRSSIPPGLGVPPGLGLPPEQLTATSYVHVAFSSPGHQPLPTVPWHGGVSPLVMTSLCGTLPADVQGAGEASPYPSSPLMSRQSSPSQSGSPSRAGSPARMQQQPQPPPPPPTTSAAERNQNFSKNMAPNRRGSHSTSCLRQNCVEPSSQSQQRSVSRKSSVEAQDTLRETLVKEMPNYQNLQKYRIEQLHCMSDEDLKELGLPNGAVVQLRSIVNKINNTNGLCNVDKREAGPNNTGRRKLESTAEAEQAVKLEVQFIVTDFVQAPERKTQSAGPIMRRYQTMPLETGPMMFPPPPPQLLTTPQGTPCYTCIAVPVSSSTAPGRYHGQAQQFYCMNHHMRSLHLDGEASRHCSNSSSASDSSSTSHSPPDTPSMPNAPQWDNRVYMGKEAGGGERWSPGCEEKERRLPESSDKSNVGVDEGGNILQHQPMQNSASNTTNSRPRLPGGLGRSKTNPPGLQTLPRGRGPNPSTVILEGNHKTLPSCRRDGPAVNGAQGAGPPRTSHPPPAPSHEDRKMFLVPTEMIQVSPHANVTYTTVNSSSQPPNPQYSGASSGSNQPRPGDMSGGSSTVPYTPATAYLPHAHFPSIRSTGAAIFPGFPPGSYIRPTYPFPNGEPIQVGFLSVPENRRMFDGEVTPANALPEIGARFPGAWTVSVCVRFPQCKLKDVCASDVTKLTNKQCCMPEIVTVNVPPMCRGAGTVFLCIKNQMLFISVRSCSLISGDQMNIIEYLAFELTLLMGYFDSSQRNCMVCFLRAKNILATIYLKIKSELPTIISAANKNCTQPASKFAHLPLVQNLEATSNSLRVPGVIKMEIHYRKLQLENPESAVERVLEPPLDEIIAAHLRCVWAVNNQDFVEAYRCQTLVVQSFTKMLQSQRDENWSLPMMNTVCLDLRLLAMHADRTLTEKGIGRPKETLEKAADKDYTKRWGMLALVNQLFKVYFRINKLHLCKPLIRAIDSSPFKDHFALGQRITYRYYVGRKAMFDSDYKLADEFLTFAFQRCHKTCWRNKRLILIYLIPVKMLLGNMPSKAVLEKYDLMQFLEVVQAVKQGNVLRLNNVIKQHEAFFIKCGIYLLLEKMKVLTYRNLFKKVYLLMKTHQIPLEALLTALKYMEITDLDLDETQCIVANLIYEGKIKGYISHLHKKLVVSKQNAFPTLSTLA
ncbi:hypothetical protein C0J52_14506 [Blattella germanica]|nr:hypothetical protein C0J52_14506 [Blattella germanica]